MQFTIFFSLEKNINNMYNIIIIALIDYLLLSSTHQTHVWQWKFDMSASGPQLTRFTKQRNSFCHIALTCWEKDIE